MTLRVVPKIDFGALARKVRQAARAHSHSWRLGDGELFAFRKYDNQLYGISPGYLAKMANTAGEQR